MYRIYSTTVNTRFSKSIQFRGISIDSPSRAVGPWCRLCLMLGRTQCSWDQSCWCWLWCWHRQFWPSRERRTGRGLAPPSFAVDGGKWKLWESEKTSGVVYPPTLATSPFCRLLPPCYLIFILWTHRNKIGIFLWEIPTLKSKLVGTL